MKIRKRIISALLGILLILAVMPVQVLAAGSIDPDRDLKLTISYKDGETALNGAQFDIYFVAEADESGELEATEPFKGFRVDIRGKNDEAWKALASTLDGYVLRDKIAPVAKGKTDQNGQLVFLSDANAADPQAGGEAAAVGIVEQRLKPGLYLVMGHPLKKGDYTYDAETFMVMLPGQDGVSNEWQYEVGVSPKFNRTKDSGGDGDKPSGGSVNRKVLKVWKDSGHEEERPGEVTVQLLRDGDVYDTVTLNRDNNWKYSWSGLPSGHTWRVTEDVPSGYTVAISSEGSTFVVTNTYDPGNPPTSIDDGDTPLGGGFGGNIPTEVIGDSGIPLSALPQTGTLWWLVPILAAAGTLMIVLGLVRRKNSGE